MAISDPIADMITKIRNAFRAQKQHTNVHVSNIGIEILKILKIEGYILSYKIISEDNKSSVRVSLKYDENKQSAMQNIKRISKPGCRVYKGYRELPSVLGGLGTVIISTAEKGIITDKDARKHRVGGELICSVW